MDTQNSPFKFLDAYEKEDKDKFFGREKEVDELYVRIFETKMILLYGASGVGKTSIIRCGLANRFNPPQWMEMFIRKRENIMTSVEQAIHNKIRQSKPDVEIPEDILEALQVLYLYNFIPVYLIFDQFEELFIFGTQEEQYDFFDFVQRILKSDLPVKILLSMREEYIAYLSDFEKQVPSLFDHRIRVEKMVRTNLTEVIQGTAKAYQIGMLEPEITIDAIINNLSDKKGIDLTNLQVYLDRLYRKDRDRKKGEDPVIFDPELVAEVGELKDVLGDFLDEQLNLLEAELGKNNVPLDILFFLVTDDGTKRAQDKEVILESMFRRKNIKNEDVEYCIRRFSEMRIFNEIDEGKIELAHDSLALKVYDKVSLEEKTLRKVEKFIIDRYTFYQNREVLLTKDDLEYINPYLEKVDISSEVRQFVNKSQAVTKKKRRIFAAIVTTIFLSISGLAIYSFIQSNLATQQAIIAQQNAEEARKSQAEAVQQRQEAQAQRQEAINQREEAKKQENIALAASSLAEERRLEALSTAAAERLARAEAVEAKIVADSARVRALLAQNAEAVQREAAVKAQKEAEAKEREARQLLILSVAQSMAARSLQLNESKLKARIAQQAYLFNIENGGEPYDRTIYEGLYYAAKGIKGENFNQLRGHRSAVQAMVFDRKGKQLFTTGSDGKLLRWSWDESIVEGKQEPVEINRVIKRDLAISPDGNWMVAGRDREPYLQLYSLTQQALAPLPLPGYSTSVLDLAYLPDGSGFLVLGNDQSLQRYNMKSSSFERIGTYKTPMRALAIRPDGQEIAAISKDGNLVFWDKDGQELSSPQFRVDSSTHSLFSITYNHRGDRVAIGDKNGIVRVWDNNNNQTLAVLRGHSARISDLIFSPDDEYLATASYDGSVQLWVVGQDNYQSRLPIILRDNESWVMSLAFSPDAKNLMTGGRDGQIKIWPTQPEKLADLMCQEMDQNFSQQEWELHVGGDIARVKTCESLPLPQSN